jgi:hypothetical protein
MGVPRTPRGWVIDRHGVNPTMPRGTRRVPFTARWGAALVTARHTTTLPSVNHQRTPLQAPRTSNLVPRQIRPLLKYFPF